MTYANQEVLEFYKELPFNIFGDLNTAINQIKANDPLEVYPELKKIIGSKKVNILDIGCGGGWLVNSLCYHHNEQVKVVGVDYNPVVINYAKEIRDKLKLKSEFYVSDLFALDETRKYDLIISLGVLHHTNNCIEAIKKILNYGNKNSTLFIGLYHKYSREPFLNHFKKIEHLSEKEKFDEYKKLHKIKDEKKLYSWFRDQVLHPHETQHTFEEMLELFSNTSYEIFSTSINNFKEIKNFNEIIDKEKTLKQYAEKKIKNYEYLPGFFIICAKNTSR